MRTPEEINRYINGEDGLPLTAEEQKFYDEQHAIWTTWMQDGGGKWTEESAYRAKYNALRVRYGFPPLLTIHNQDEHEEIREKVEELRKQYGRRPFILVTDKPDMTSEQVYARIGEGV